MTNILKFSTQRLGSLLSIVFSADHDLKRSKEITISLSKYIESMSHGINCRGTRDTINLYKELHLIAVKIAMGRPFEPLKFRKSRKDGTPKLLQPVVPFLHGSPRDKRIALSITKLYVALNCTPSEDFSSITDPFRGKLLDHR